MRDQYVGDISDYLKYALLRDLGRTGKSLGVAWYYNPEHDGRTDGGHVEFLEDERWAALDPDLWSSLKSLPERTVTAVERAPIWPLSTSFHRTAVAKSNEREIWSSGMARALATSDLIFVDPDNGLGAGSVRAGSVRHATAAELKSLCRPGRAILLIKFPGRVIFDLQEDVHHQTLRDGTGSPAIMTMRTSVMVRGSHGGMVPRARWFTLMDHDLALANRMRDFGSRLNAISGARASIRPD